MRKSKMRVWVTAQVLLFISALLVPATVNTTLTREDFMKRRQLLMQAAGEGMIILFGDVQPAPPLRFRQDNDFYYFSGIEDKEAVLVMLPKGGETYLFLPEQTPREAMMEGANMLHDLRANEKTGVNGVYDLAYLDEFLARRYEAHGPVLYLRLSPPDALDSGRYEVRLQEARCSRSRYNDQPGLDQYRIARLKERYPDLQFRDVTPLVRSRRLIKSPKEIEILRRNGEISAEAVKRAMLSTKPGAFEYELEAAAVGWVLQNGGRGPAFAPIVGSGPNTCTWHYDKNNRQMGSGELVLMDFGAELEYMCMDISRTWPVSGTFTREQRRVYRAVLEVQKACIEAYKPNVTAADVERYVSEKMSRLGIDTLGLKGEIHHCVGLSVHDGSIGMMPLKEGMVFTIEPGLYYPEKNIGVRIEDTVLITRDGCEVLTAGVPKEIEEIEALLRGRVKQVKKNDPAIFPKTSKILR